MARIPKDWGIKGNWQEKKAPLRDSPDNRRKTTRLSISKTQRMAWQKKKKHNELVEEGPASGGIAMETLAKGMVSRILPWRSAIDGGNH